MAEKKSTVRPTVTALSASSCSEVRSGLLRLTRTHRWSSGFPSGPCRHAKPTHALPCRGTNEISNDTSGQTNFWRRQN